jgi:hypothetical protein
MEATLGISLYVLSLQQIGEEKNRFFPKHRRGVGGGGRWG